MRKNFSHGGSRFLSKNERKRKFLGNYKKVSLKQFTIKTFYAIIMSAGNGFFEFVKTHKNLTFRRNYKKKINNINKEKSYYDQQQESASIRC